MRRYSGGWRRSVDRGTYGRGIEPRKPTLRGADAVVRGGRPHGPATTTRAAAQPRAVGDPSHVRKLLVREPGEPSLARGGWFRGTRRQGRAPYSGDERGRAVGQTCSTNEADEQGQYDGGGVGGEKGSGQGKHGRAKRAPDTEPDPRAQCARPCASRRNQEQADAVHGAPSSCRHRETPRGVPRTTEECRARRRRRHMEAIRGAARGQPPRQGEIATEAWSQDPTQSHGNLRPWPDVGWGLLVRISVGLQPRGILRTSATALSSGDILEPSTSTLANG